VSRYAVDTCSMGGGVGGGRVLGVGFSRSSYFVNLQAVPVTVTGKKNQ
jgi:hypothetical protein